MRGGDAMKQVILYHATAMLVIEGEVLIGFVRNRKRVEELLA